MLASESIGGLAMAPCGVLHSLVLKLLPLAVLVLPLVPMPGLLGAQPWAHTHCPVVTDHDPWGPQREATEGGEGPLLYTGVDPRGCTTGEPGVPERCPVPDPGPPTTPGGTVLVVVTGTVGSPVVGGGEATEETRGMSGDCSGVALSEVGSSDGFVPLGWCTGGAPAQMNPGRQEGLPGAAWQVPRVGFQRGRDSPYFSLQLIALQKVTPSSLVLRTWSSVHLVQKVSPPYCTWKLGALQGGVVVSWRERRKG